MSENSDPPSVEANSGLKSEKQPEMQTSQPTPQAGGGASEDVPGGPPDHEYPPTKTIIVLMAALFLAGFLVALDRTIIGVAVPIITNHFHSLGDVGWYASAYMITACSFQLFMGKIYQFYNPKIVWLSNVLLFEVGSAICGAAPSSPVFIFGRAVAGLGSCGIFSGTIIIMMYAVPLYKRPAYTGIMGAVFGVASVVGPLLGGVLTDNVSWRWCFFINLPIGALAAAIIAFFIKLPLPKQKPISLRDQVYRLDLEGLAVFLPGCTCLLMALEWGGTTYGWSNWCIVLLLVFFGLLMIAFIAIQIWKQERATVPPRIFKHRAVLCGVWWTLMIGATMMTLVYFLPFWFQAIKGVSAVKSGIDTIPMVLGLVFASIMAGFLTRKIGYYVPWMYVTSVITPIATGLISTFTTTTGHAKWIGYQVLFGFGLGMGMQQANVGVQVALSRKDLPIGASMMFFCQSLGGAVFVSLANNIFDNQLAKGLRGIAGLDPAQIVKVGATDLRKIIPPGQLPHVLESYNHALVCTFYVAVALSSCCWISAVFSPWVSIKGRDAGGPSQKKGEEGKATEEKDTQLVEADVNTSAGKPGTESA